MSERGVFGVRASDILRTMEERKENQVMILYKDERGRLRNLIYQDLMFFETTGRHEYKMLGNPAVLREIINNMKSGKYKYIGKGKYSQPVKFTNVKVM